MFRMSIYLRQIDISNGGGGGIRTHDPLARKPVFKTGALVHYATPPCVLIITTFPAGRNLARSLLAGRLPARRLLESMPDYVIWLRNLLILCPFLPDKGD